MKLVNRSGLVLKPTAKMLYLTWQEIQLFGKHLI